MTEWTGSPRTVAGKPPSGVAPGLGLGDAVCVGAGAPVALGPGLGVGTCVVHDSRSADVTRTTADFTLIGRGARPIRFEDVFETVDLVDLLAHALEAEGSGEIERGLVVG